MGLVCPARLLGGWFSLTECAGCDVELDERISRLAAQAKQLSGMVYRSAVPQYANTADLVTGEGSWLVGGRWNPAGVAAVYGSFTPQTAMEETLAHSRYYELPVHAAMPRTFVAIAFHLVSVLDLTDGAVRRSLPVSKKRLLECDWRAGVQAGKTPLTQQIGRAVHRAGLEGLLVPSAADLGGWNLVVFVENLQSGSTLEVVAADRLSSA